jgi:hypothetical protein
LFFLREGGVLASTHLRKTSISDEDSKLIQEMADVDGDGKIGLDDFRGMVPFGKKMDTKGI